MDAVVFPQMNGFAECPGILPEGVGTVERVQPGRAETAQAAVIQRRSVQERSLAPCAEVFGQEGLGAGETETAERNVGTSVERGTADPAIVRKDEAYKRCRESPRNAAVDGD